MASNLATKASVPVIASGAKQPPAIRKDMMIEPKILKGFRDFLPRSEMTRQMMTDALKGVFLRYGFVPIDTPCLEYSEVLLRKSNGETEKQVFRFNDNGGRDVALRFDLTVPFARFIAMHRDALYFPFKRYHIAKVWRGEKPQGGRYREFTQCDFDTIGCDSAASDAETLLLMGDALRACTTQQTGSAAGVTIHVNHRGVLTRFLKHIGASDKSDDVLRSIDRLAKVGADKVRSELAELSGEVAADKIMEYISARGTWDEVLAKITALSGGDGDDTKRLVEVHEILEAAIAASNSSLTANRLPLTTKYILDPSITRGLDYYTGVVFESFLDGLPSIGSVCSGGRYDNLAGLYMKEHLSGVGASVGLDRLIAAMDTLREQDAAGDGASSNRMMRLDVEVFADESSTPAARESLAASFRAAGLRAEAFGEVQKMCKQYAVAEKKGAVWGAFVKADGKVTMKHLATRQSTDYISAAVAVNDVFWATMTGRASMRSNVGGGEQGAPLTNQGGQ